ncbi:FHA domain-containing protein [Hyphomonas sp.]|uniref:FHA domain-containing protein n=1 Tax=Hyphomonas sp. TaxID=87 RepID=UPI003453B234
MAELIYCEVHSDYVTPEVGRCPLCRLVVSDGYHRSVPQQAEGTSHPDAWVVFPWGEEPVFGELRIGRFPSYSPIAAKLSEYGGISRRHCSIRQERGFLWLKQVGQTHPTFVDGVAIVAGDEAVLGHGTLVSFAGELTAHVRCKEDAG